jgi:hypothetical protein
VISVDDPTQHNGETIMQTERELTESDLDAVSGGFASVEHGDFKVAQDQQVDAATSG